MLIGMESYCIGPTVPITWSGLGLVNLELLAGGEVVGTIAENLPGTRAGYMNLVGEQ